MTTLATRLRRLDPRYRRAQREARVLYRAWSDLPLPAELVHPLWEDARRGFAELVLGGVPPDFLSHQLVRHMLYRTGFGELEQIELDYLEAAPAALRRRCLAYREPWAGAPARDGRRPFAGSVSALNKLYYFVRIAERIPLERVRTIVDFGGGYGLMCHVLQELVQPRPTVAIVDLPELLALQYVVLETAAAGPVVAHTVPPVELRPGAANLVPVQLLSGSGITCDLFVSTFALSETTPALQRVVAASGFLGASSLYVTGQETTAELWQQYGLSEMSLVLESARRRYTDVRLEPFPVVSAWELTATTPRPARQPESA